MEMLSVRQNQARGVVALKENAETMSILKWTRQGTGYESVAGRIEKNIIWGYKHDGWNFIPAEGVPIKPYGATLADLKADTQKHWNKFERTKNPSRLLVDASAYFENAARSRGSYSFDQLPHAVAAAAIATLIVSELPIGKPLEDALSAWVMMGMRRAEDFEGMK